MKRIDEHLRLLSVFHYVVAGLTALFGLFPIFHLIIGIIFLTVDPSEFAPPPEQAESENGSAPPEMFPKLFGGIFAGVAGAIMLFFFATATLILIGGRRLAQRRSYRFCLVVAGISCMIMPFGTALGVFTLIVLLKSEAREAFGLSAYDDNQATNHQR